MENLDETHFTINMDNGWILDFWDDTFDKYANVVARGCNDHGCPNFSRP